MKLWHKKDLYPTSPANLGKIQFWKLFGMRLWHLVNRETGTSLLYHLNHLVLSNDLANVTSKLNRSYCKHTQQEFMVRFSTLLPVLEAIFLHLCLRAWFGSRMEKQKRSVTAIRLCVIYLSLPYQCSLCKRVRSVSLIRCVFWHVFSEVM